MNLDSNIYTYLSASNLAKNKIPNMSETNWVVDPGTKIAEPFFLGTDSAEQK